MGFQLRKSYKAGPIRFNLSKSGIGASVGGKGLRVGVKSNGKSYVNAGGSGMYYRKEFNSSKDKYTNTKPSLKSEIKELVFIKDRSELLEGHKPEKLKNHILLYVLFFSLGFVPLVGAIYWWYVSLRNLFKRTVRFYFYDSVPVYVSDRRYKTGRRIESYRNVKKYTNAISSPTKNERVLFAIKGIVALLIALSLSGYNYMMFNEIRNQNSKEIVSTLQSGIVISKSGLNLREYDNKASKVLLTIPYGESINILDYKENSINWIKVEYNGTSGWVWKELIEIKE